jgi:hypothetical protein
MIQAVLQGKSAGCEYSEDMVTSTVFGSLRYLPTEVLITFLESAFVYNEERTTLWKHLQVGNYELRRYRKIKYFFWPRHKKHGEPDLILLFTGHVHNQEDLMLLVEVKFKSGKSSTGENDQLKRYYQAINFDLKDFSESELSNFRGQKKCLLYLTEADSHLEIEESIRELKKDCPEFLDHIFHLRWHQLFKIFESTHSGLSSTGKIIVQDLLNLMQNLGLKDFSGITLPDEKLQIIVQKNYPIFYFKKPAEVIEHFHSYFKELPELFIKKHTSIFYKENQTCPK